MSDDRCEHGRVVFTRTCEAIRCFECEPVTREEFDEQEAEIERLRGLTERAEKTHLHPDLIGCPWCGARREGKNPEPHAAGCPAFTPDGTVR